MKVNVNLDQRVCGQIARSNLSEYAIVMYLALKSLYNPNMEIQYLSINTLIYQIDTEFITRTPSFRSKNSKKYVDSLYELESLEFIKLESASKDFFIIDMSGLYTDTIKSEEDVWGDKIENDKAKSYFTTIDLDLIRELIDVTQSKNIIKFLFYFLGCKYENDSMFFFNKTREEMEKEINMDSRTIDKYLDLLIEFDLIHAYRYDYKWSDSSKQLPSAYGLAEDKEIIDSFCYGFIKKNEEKIYHSKTGKKDKAKEDITENIEETKVIEEENKAQIYNWKENLALLQNEKEELKERNQEEPENEIGFLEFDEYSELCPF